MTETAELADVVLPAALWAEKTGTFTNMDRTVHLSDQAIEPPDEARSDLAIFLDYARRMDFRDRDGWPLVKWRDPESAFEAFQVRHSRPAVRLLRALVRSPARRVRHPVAVQRAVPRRRRAPLHGRRLQHERAGVRGVGPRPGHGRGDRRRGVPREGPARTRGHQARRSRAAAGAAGCLVSVLAHDRARRLPRPHAHEDSALEGAAAGGARPVRRDRDPGRATARHRGWRSGARRDAPRSHRRPRTDRRHPPRAPLRAVPLRVLGQRRASAGGATTLLVALGALQAPGDAMHVVAGVFTIPISGQIVRGVRLCSTLARPLERAPETQVVAPPADEVRPRQQRAA